MDTLFNTHLLKEGGLFPASAEKNEKDQIYISPQMSVIFKDYLGW